MTMFIRKRVASIIRLIEDTENEISYLAGIVINAEIRFREKQRYSQDEILSRWEYLNSTK